MLFASRLLTASSILFLSGSWGAAVTLAPATAAPYDQLEQSCKPKFAGTHDCLEPVPAYSYHLPLTSNYSGELCLGLGDWEGENKVVIEWDGLQTRLQLTGKAGVNHLLQPEKREGRSSAVVLYSDLPLMPNLVEQGCGKGRSTDAVTAVAWNDDMTEAEQGSLAQVPGGTTNERGADL